MPANIATAPTSTKNPFEAARRRLIAGLLALKAPVAYPTFPSPVDHDGVAAHLREAAAIFDEWLAAVGAEVRDNATGHVSTDLFAGSFTAAIDGNETWALEQASTELRDEHRAMRRAS